MPPSRDPKESRKVRKNRTIKGSRSSTHIRRSSQAMKQTFHSDEQKVKKKLVEFVKEEYIQKKPREIRLLKLKPKTVFKKGTILPNIMIKAFQITAFVIYLDFGEELRFYLFSAAGQSLGATTVEKTEKMLKELHGKAITLYNLPKISSTAKFDKDSIEINQKFQKMIKLYKQKWGNPLKNIPTISVRVFQNRSHPVRFGVQSKGNIISVNKELINKPELQIIILREIFMIFWDLDENKTTDVLLATIWALSRGSTQSAKEYTSLLRNFAFSRKIHKKTQEWIKKWIEPSLQNETIHLNKLSELADLIYNIISYIQKIEVYRDFCLNEALLLYVMSSSSNLINQQKKNKLSICKENEIFLISFVEFCYSHSKLIKQYELKLGTNLSSFSLWILYFGLKINSDFNLNIQKSSENILFPPVHEDEKMKFKKIIKLWKKQKLYELYNSIVPEYEFHPKKSQLLRIFKEKILKIFPNIGIIRISPKNSEIIINKNESKKITITLENQTDLILYHAEYEIKVQPTKGISVIFEDIPHSNVFDMKIQFLIKINRESSQKKYCIQLLGQFDDPFGDSSERITIPIIKLEIH
ncbi:MAG: hypothetical protein K9W44_07795 [Candidatus Lokiarchaeota archaeon]|nr:hypothetical protein [Candidatus Harpocratesius repetitus]